jgi:DNA polymerase III alpha subunit
VEKEGAALRVGLSYCKGISEKAISSIISERGKRSFSSTGDLYQRTDVEQDSLENLIGGGFLDALSDRNRLLEEAQKLPKKRKNDRQPEIPMPHPASWWEARESGRATYLPLTETRRERMEWETLGLNVSRHPLSPYRTALKELGVSPSEEISGLPHGVRTRAAGLFEILQCPPTKSGHPVYFLLIEDEQGLLQATIFRPVYVKYGDVLHHRGAFLLEGRVEQDRSRGFSFLVERIGDLREALAEIRMPVARAASASETFPRAKRRSRRAG